MMKMLKPCSYVCIGVLMSVAVTACNSRMPSAQNSQQTTKISFRVATFNIRCPVDPSPNSWEERVGRMRALIERHRFDLMGLQEATADQIDDLLTEGWAYVGVGRDDGGRGGEASCIFYKKARFKVENSGTFWLSETPEVPGSKSWNTACPRICTWAKMTDVITGQQFVCFNTHLDHKSAAARENGIRLILERMPGFAQGLPVLLTGDLNVLPEAEPIRLVREILKDASEISVAKHTGPYATFNAFKTVVKPSRRIDYIFVSPGVKVAAHATLDDSENGLYPSDHFPVMADVVICPVRDTKIELF